MTALGVTFTRRGGGALVDGVAFPTLPAGWTQFIERVELRGERLIEGKAEFGPVRIGDHTFETNGRTAHTGMVGRGSYVTSQYPAEAWTSFILRADLAARRRMAASLRAAGRNPCTGEEEPPCKTIAPSAGSATAAPPPAAACVRTAIA